MEKLIEHLEDMLAQENDKLQEMAINAMEDASEFPFPEKSLTKWHAEYKLMQSCILGIIDTIEEVKAFHEGFFDRDQIIEGVEG